MKKPNFKRKELFFLVVIFLLSLSIRLIKLGNVPNGLTVDEADMGYNAFSILKTGADVYGRKLPLFFQSLDDYKAAFGIYAPLPAIALFGLNEFSIRIIPAIIGSITPALVFVFTKLLYPRSKTIPLVASILTIFAPWNIAISRANLPYIELIFLYILLLIAFFWAIFKNRKLMPLTAILAAATLYVYYAAIIYLPFMLLIIFVLYKDKLIENLKFSTLSLIILFALSMPALVHYQTSQSKSRLNVISIFTPDITLPTSISEMGHDTTSGISYSQITHNRRAVYLNTFLDNYFDYFRLDYLFVNSSSIRYFYTNYVGLFYLIELPFFLFGFYKLVTRREKSDLLILAFLVIGQIPASITLGSPFPHRGILLLLTIQLTIAIGVSTFLENIKKFHYSVKLKWALAAIYLASVYFFIHQYFIHSPKEFTSENDNGAWFSTARDVIPTVNFLKGKYDRVVFTWSQGKLVPMVYFLFYNQVDPKVVQDKAAKWTNEPPSYRQIYGQIEKIEFRPIDWVEDQKLKNTLFIGYASEFPKDVKVIDRSYLPNGKEHLLFVETN